MTFSWKLKWKLTRYARGSKKGSKKGQYQTRSYDIEYIDKATHDRLEYILSGTSWKLNGYAEAISQNKGITNE